MVGGVEAGVCSGGVNCDAEIAAKSNKQLCIYGHLARNN